MAPKKKSLIRFNNSTRLKQAAALENIQVFNVWGKEIMIRTWTKAELEANRSSAYKYAI